MLVPLVLIAGCIAVVVTMSQAPINATNEFVALIDDGEIEAAYDSLCASTRASLTLEAFTEDMSVDGEITDYTLTPAAAALRGTARVSGTIEIDDEPQNVAFRLEKEGETWRVCSYDPLE